MTALVPWVAVVDDDELLRRALARLLRAHGIEARTFHSAQDYLSLTPGAAPACMILDMHLRDSMTGLELSEHLRARNVTPPIIFITAQEESEMSPGGVARANTVLLSKPFDPDSLLALVAERLAPNFANTAQ
jgi:FixJ family two-component response regulator